MDKPLRWRLEPREKGLARVVQGRRGWNLHRGEEILARVRPLTEGIGTSGTSGWYWYGMGKNTCRQPVGTAEEAKIQAVEHVRAAIKAKEEADAFDSSLTAAYAHDPDGQRALAEEGMEATVEALETDAQYRQAVAEGREPCPMCGRAHTGDCEEGKEPWNAT